jgi:flagella basal body P-ring formation protein FlgA
MDPKYRQIIENATKLAERSIIAFEAEQKLKEIETKFNELSKKAEKEERNLEEFKSKVNKMADVLVTRGILDDNNKVAFVQRIAENPGELAEVAIKLSSEMKAETFGKVGEYYHDVDTLDPFERLAIE